LNAVPRTLEQAYRSEKAADEYDMRHRRTATRRRVTRREVRLVAELLGRPGPKGLLIDAACGTGRISEGLRVWGWEIVALDASLDMLKQGVQARRLQAERAVNASIFRLPYGDKKADGMVCIRFMHHLPEKNQRLVVLEELARVCRGPLVVSIWTRCNLQFLRRRLKNLLGRRGSARYPLNLRSFRKEAKQAGLEVRKIRRLFPLISETMYVLLSPTGRAS
jgi:ubiquinone/menaquinone biosynthesis C-methylase UbiE